MKKNIWFRRIGIGILVFLGIELVVDFSTPGILTALEQIPGITLSFESALRVYFFSFFLLALVVCGIALARSEKKEWNFFYFAYCIWFLLLVGVFAFDRHHRLFEEYSWIRYTTAFSLFAASLVSFWSLVVFRKIQTHAMRAILFLFGAAFLFVGFDELFQIHEKFGLSVEKTTGISHVFTDYITVGYALVGIFVIFCFWHWYKNNKEKYPLFFFFLFSGIGIYALSTALDTFDVNALEILRKGAFELSRWESFIISDLWYGLWSVKNSLNGLEEVFEYLAAFSFFMALTAFAVVEGKKFGQPLFTPRISKKVFHLGAGVIGCLYGLGVILSFPLIAPQSPVAFPVSAKVSQIASAHDGLFHVDDLFYHPSWGVLIADEGSRGIYQWYNNELTKIPDSDKKIKNADSVTATSNAIYVSDPELGIIFSYTSDAGYIPLWTRKNGLMQPEGLIAVGDILYVVDESEKSITKLQKGKEPVIWKPQHPQFKAPEDIAYDPLTKKLFVTDDVSGALFEIDFGKDLTVLEMFPKPESIVSDRDGSFYVTDTKLGTVFKIAPGGKKEKVLKFHRNYQDLQGIALDQDGVFYVSTSDGYGSSSFMPSFVFKVSK